MLRVGQLFTKPAEAGFFSSAPGCTAGGPASVAVAHHPGTGPARMLPSLRAPRVVVTRPAPGHLGTSIRAARPERITLHWRARPDPRPRRRRLWGAGVAPAGGGAGVTPAPVPSCGAGPARGAGGGTPAPGLQTSKLWHELQPPPKFQIFQERHQKTSTCNKKKLKQPKQRVYPDVF